jgi:hypothetical protein
VAGELGAEQGVALGSGDDVTDRRVVEGRRRRAHEVGDLVRGERGERRRQGAGATEVGQQFGGVGPAVRGRRQEQPAVSIVGGEVVEQRGGDRSGPVHVVDDDQGGRDRRDHPLDGRDDPQPGQVQVGFRGG